MKKDIETPADVEILVHTFYGKVREDEMLKDIFNNVIEDRWPEHLEKLVKFWSTVLLGIEGYYGAPFAPHAGLPVEREHFERWLALFHETLDEHFQGVKTEEARLRSLKMAEMFQFKIAYFRENYSKPLL